MKKRKTKILFLIFILIFISILLGIIFFILNPDEKIFQSKTQKIDEVSTNTEPNDNQDTIEIKKKKGLQKV